MRLALIAVTVSCFWGFSTHAFGAEYSQGKTVASLEIELSNKDAQYSVFIDSLADLNNQVNLTEANLADYRNEGKVLEQARAQALLNMNEQYELMIDNPDQDIAPAQQSYRQAIINQKKNKENIKLSVANLANIKEELADANIERFTLANAREALTEEIKIARVARLRSEFELQKELEVSQSVNCDPLDTLKKCITHGNRLAKQKASKMFLDSLYLSAIESTLINKNRNESAARVKLLNHKVISGEFSGQGIYSTNISVQMQGALPEAEACKLLAISSRYCNFVKVDPIATVYQQILGGEQSEKDDSILYELTVRSNQYDDEVFIDGVSYGSTRLSLMLSSGKHSVVIGKPGYQDHHQDIHLNRNLLIKAELVKTSINFANGQKIQDVLPGDELGPDLVGIPAGNFQMGDLKGAGLTNEKPSRSEQILTSFAIGQNQITVGDFKHFVNATSYVTDAESGEGCVAFVDGDPRYNAVLNWRNPGFSQTDQHPVVCVSEKDSLAYLAWLSKTTDQKYRLPSETEWEYVARAGNDKNFWWGNDIGNGKANCAYCGSRWSNLSTAPVQSFRSNDFGLFDTVGNVWELTKGETLVARGGAWNFAPKLARTSVRLELSDGFRSNYLGFRALREN